MELKCCMCTDRLIADGGSYPETDLPDAITWVPMRQTVNADGVAVVGIVMMPVCFADRARMLGTVSRAGLVTG